MESNQNVFISHSSADSKLAYAMCDYLEEKGIRCWIAPRNIPVGVKYGKSIIMGIKTCKIMVVLFNKNSNASEAVETEVERAFNYKTILIPFKLDETIPSDSLEFSFGSFQWLNATKGNPEDHFDLLYQNCARVLGKKESPIKEKPILPLTHEKKENPIKEKPILPLTHEIKENPIKEKPILPLTHEKKESPIKEKSGHYQEEKNSLANKENESKKKKSIILIASLGAILLISIFFYKVDEGEVTIGSNSSVEGAIGNQRDQSNNTFEVTIGSQVWTTKNLDVSAYRNGDVIPEVKEAAVWANLTTGAWCYYENKTANGTTYGKLYNWYAVSDKRGLAPKGYHIPTDEEWTTLTNYLGVETIAGSKMKSSSGWENNANGTNTIGFAGLPGGYRNSVGNFYKVGAGGKWWSSSENNTDIAWCRYLNGSDGDVYRDYYYKQFGFSVRCLRD